MYFYASILFKIFFKLLNLIYDMAIKPSCYYRGSMFYIRISKENIKIFFKTGSIFLPILYVLLNIVFHNVPNIGLFVFYIWIIIIILKHNINYMPSFRSCKCILLRWLQCISLTWWVSNNRVHVSDSHILLLVSMFHYI